MSATVHRLKPAAPLPTPEAQVTQFDFFGDDARLVDALRHGHPGAPAAFFDRYGTYVERLLVRVIGPDQEIADLLHEVFAEALDHIAKLDNPEALKGWLTRITVFAARGCIRRRTRRRWLRFMAPEEVPEMQADAACAETRDLLARSFRILDRMPADERIAFSLRYIDDMTLPEAADACGTSLATFKRRLRRARDAFEAAAAKDPALKERLADRDDGVVEAT